MMNTIHFGTYFGRRSSILAFIAICTLVLTSAFRLVMSAPEQCYSCGSASECAFGTEYFNGYPDCSLDIDGDGNLTCSVSGSQGSC